MRFWDSSAIIPLLVEERTSAGIGAEYQRDPDVVVWWATEVECVSALARLEREGSITASTMTEAVDRLDKLALAWHEVQPATRTRQVAIRLLRTHALRAADAFQLAAAIGASEDTPDSLSLVTMDARLGIAAEREGFRVVSSSLP
jgi:predicted nucleic acid-binding protein